MTRKIERWWQERTATIRGLRADLQAVQTDYETLDRLHMETAAAERRLSDQVHYLRHENALMEESYRMAVRRAEQAEHQLASLRDSIGGERAARIQKAQLAGDAA